VFDPEPAKKSAGKRVHLYLAMMLAKHDLTIGVSNRIGMSERDQWVFFILAPELAPFGLVEKSNLSNGVQRFQWSTSGLAFLAEMEVEFVTFEKKVAPPKKPIARSSRKRRSRRT
jgi:hypothetical protein